MRYFLECSFVGTPFQGWQKQPGKPTVQETLEQKLQVFLKKETAVVGCGRTDTGVHAHSFIAHFDAEQELDPGLIYHLNAILPPEIAVRQVFRVGDEAHARYDAITRTYQYHIHGVKSPFLIDKSFFYNRFDQLNTEDLQRAAQLLLNYAAFYPFCLSRSGVKNYSVQIHQTDWKYNAEGELIFSISANRFLRGMVRLIVGMCINRALGHLEEADVIQSLERQQLLAKSWSVPSYGLYLMGVTYPYWPLKETGV